jgi:DNA repair and recombination RAD54-like protein
MSDSLILEYEVLYYKRSNKVHKSKGVSKIDGTLQINTALMKVSLYQTTTTTTTDNNNQDTTTETCSNHPAVASTVNKELCKRTLEEDDTLVLGGFEVQIVARKQNEKEGGGGGENQQHAAGVSALTTTTNASTWNKSKASTIRTVSNPLKRKLVLQPRPLVSVKQPTTASTGSLVGRGSSSSSTMLAKKQTTKPFDSDSEDDEEEATTTTTTKPVAMNPIRPRVGGLVSRKPVTAFAGRSGIGHKKSTLGGGGGVTIAPRGAASTSTTTTATATTSFSSFSILPHIPLPATLAQTLRPHQVTGVDFLWKALLLNNDSIHNDNNNNNNNSKGAILADEMGLGKTLMTIAVIAAMHRQDRSKQFVVVCPSSLVNNWANEFDKWIGKAGSPKRVVIKKGGEEGLAQIKAYCSKMKQLSNHRQNGQVLIISYDLLRMKAAEQFQSMAQQQTFKLLIVDEGHRLKNTAGSLTLTALESIQCDARLCITATPIQNNLSEFYTIANFCCPGCLGDLPSFRRNFERPIAASSGSNATQQQRRLGAMQAKELDKITQTFMLRRLQKDILKTMLPPRCEMLLFCQPSVEQCDLYRSITQDETLQQDDNNNNNNNNNNAAEALTKLTALRKICLHPSLYDADDTVGDSLLVAQSGKLVVLDALLMSIRKHAPSDKVVLVSNFTSALSVVESLVLEPRSLSFARLDGTTDVQNRQPLVDSFNRASPEQTFCLLLSSKAGGVGLNLIGANRLIMLDADWNPALDIQAMVCCVNCGRLMYYAGYFVMFDSLTWPSPSFHLGTRVPPGTDQARVHLSSI